MKVLFVTGIFACTLSNVCLAQNSTILTSIYEDRELSMLELSISESDFMGKSSDFDFDLLDDKPEMTKEERKKQNRKLKKEVRKLEWEEGNPQAAWIMSYPESGIAHIMNIIQQSSHMATATNYGHILLKEDGTFERSENSVHIYENGPVWYNLDLEKPTKYVATRTHGTGYCLFCHPKQYYYGNFWWKSSSGVRIVDGARTFLQYNPKDVPKMIHFLRDPYDNVVARFSSYIGLMNANRPDLNIESRFPKNKDGFRKWCKLQDRGFQTVDLKWLPEELREMAKDVPCRQEFVKYARFHTNAFLMARFRKIEYMVLKYDEFAKDQSAAILKMNDFLGYPVNNTDIKQTIPGDGIWNFEKFYTLEERKIIEKLLRNLSKPPIWYHIRDYTPDFYHDSNNDNPDAQRIKEGQINDNPDEQRMKEGQ